MFLFLFWAPIFSTSEELFDFGDALITHVYTHVFYIKNNGDETLVIERVRPDCGCSKTFLSKKKIPPGGRTALRFIFDSYGFYGEKIKKAYIHTNVGTKVVKIKINLVDKLDIPGLKVDEFLLIQDVVLRKDTCVLFQNTADKELTIKVVSLDKELVLRAWPEEFSIKPGETKKVKLDLRLKKNRGNGCVTFMVRYPNGKVHRFSIPVLWVKKVKRR